MSQGLFLADGPSDDSMDTSPPSQEVAAVFDLPNEIQRQIFEEAASLDGKCALRLCQVARYVYIWVHPILYRRVVIQSPQSAISFFRTLRSRPRGYFEPMIKSLALGSNVTLPQAKALLVECSRRILVLTIFRHGRSKEKILDYVKTPYLKRLTMVCHRDWPPEERWFGFPNAQYDIPVGLTGSLTHLAIVVDYEIGSWFSLNAACLLPFYPDHPVNLAAYAAFQNLTHVATSVKALDHNLRIRKIAKNLRYFAILEPRDHTPEEHEALVAKVREMESIYEYPAVSHSTIILRDLGDPDVWKITDSFRPLELWRRVERLVADGYITDRGERWS